LRPKEICPKCKQKRYPHQHHILPKVLFGKIGFISRICSDCHEEYHESLRDALKRAVGGMKQPPIFYVKHFITWMGGSALLLYIIFKIL
jgi:hypothetical protein